MAYRIVINTSSLTKEQEEHLLGCDGVLESNLIVFAHMGTFNSDEVFPQYLFNDEFCKNNIFEYDTWFGLDTPTKLHLDNFPDWLYGKIEKNTLEVFRVEAFIDYYLKYIFEKNLKAFEENIKEKTHCMASHLTESFDAQNELLIFSYVDLQVNLSYESFANRSCFDSMNIKERTGFLTVFFYYLSIDEDAKKRFISCYKFPKFEMYGHLSSALFKVGPMAIFAERNDYFLEAEPNKKILNECLSYLNDKFNTHVRIDK